MNDSRTIWKWFADWLAVRRPTRLIADGVFLMFWAGVVYLGWSIWWEVNESALRMAPTRLDRSVSLALSSLRVVLFDLGVVLVAAGCARMIADAVAAKRRSTVASDEQDLPPAS